MCKVQVHSLCVLCSLCGGEGTLCFKLINRVEQRSLLFYGLSLYSHNTATCRYSNSESKSLFVLLTTAGLPVVIVIC